MDGSAPAGRGVRVGRRRPPIGTFVEAALAGDDARAASIAVDYLSVRGSWTDVNTDLLYGAQRHVDQLWQLGEATAKDELAVARSVEVALEAMALAAPPAQVAQSRGRALLATVDPEPHDIGLRMVAAALRDDGWAVQMLLRTTAAELEDWVGRGRYGLAALSTSWDTPELRMRMREVVQLLRRRAIPVLLGGVGIERRPRLAEAVLPDVVPADARQAVTVARRLLRGQAMAVRPAYSLEKVQPLVQPRYS